MCGRYDPGSLCVMHVATTVPTEDPARAGELFSRLERIGYHKGEVADGLIVHPFNSRRSLEHLVDRH
jgi:hypothetical protein